MVSHDNNDCVFSGRSGVKCFQYAVYLLGNHLGIVLETLGCEFRPVYCSPAVYYEVEGGAREFRQALAKGGYGHHQAIIYGNHVKELQELGEIVGFEVEVFH